MKRKLMAVVGAVAIGCSVVAVAASGASAHAPSPNIVRCHVHTIRSAGTATFHGHIYATAPHTVLRYWVRIRNASLLRWSGSVSPDGALHDATLPPFGSHWMPSPAIPLAPEQRGTRYSLSVTSRSFGTSALMIEVYAPACS